MKYIIKNNHRISKIGLGTSKFGTLIDYEKSYELLDKFVEFGGNVIDTARNYYEWVEGGRGISEKTIGNWLNIKKNRSKVMLVTKGGVSNHGHDWDINLEKSNLMHELYESQVALGTDKINIYLLHRDDSHKSVEEIVETMQEIAEKAQADYIGVCNWNIKRIKEANSYAIKNSLVPFKIIQTWWSLAEYKKDMWNDENTTYMDKESFNYILNEDLIGMAYTSQAKGFFQKAVMNGIDEVDEFLKKRILTKRNAEKVEYIKKFCESRNLSPTAIINSYITSSEVNGIALVSCSNIMQLINILENCDYNLEQEVISEIDSI